MGGILEVMTGLWMVDTEAFRSDLGVVLCRDLEIDLGDEVRGFLTNDWRGARLVFCAADVFFAARPAEGLVVRELQLAQIQPGIR